MERDHRMPVSSTALRTSYCSHRAQGLAPHPIILLPRCLLVPPVPAMGYPSSHTAQGHLGYSSALQCTVKPRKIKKKTGNHLQTGHWDGYSISGGHWGQTAKFAWWRSGSFPICWETICSQGGSNSHRAGATTTQAYKK